MEELLFLSLCHSNRLGQGTNSNLQMTQLCGCLNVGTPAAEAKPKEKTPSPVKEVTPSVAAPVHDEPASSSSTAALKPDAHVSKLTKPAAVSQPHEEKHPANPVSAAPSQVLLYFQLIFFSIVVVNNISEMNEADSD